ncbi:DUF6082 family protein [Streptomyces sp. CB01635]|uniref:DUF6082 family protein n=1 Tax=unclassified Streptomyces TaxID=2593676 RepID=UPI001F377A32|nr:DUF6082 family protein [Streptomyces sp. CB01635]
MATQSNGIWALSAAALAGFALGGATSAFAKQQRRREEARLRTEQLERDEVAERGRARAHQQRMHWALLVKAIDDPSLAVVINTYGADVPLEKLRQYFYANAWYVNLFHLEQSGLVDQEQVYGHLRDFFQSPVFREYWEATRNHRIALKHSSDEARLGRLADRLYEELEEADTDEWWVVGDPQTF